MADKERKTFQGQRCARCGQELNDLTARRMSTGLLPGLREDIEIGFSYLCLDCQQTRYNKLAAATSPQLAIFYCCIAFDAPFDIEAVDKTGEAQEAWKAYCDNLRIKKLDEEDGEPLGFLDGVTDITKIFGANLSVKEFNKAVGIDLSRKYNKQPGTAKQRETWGTGNPKKPYNSDDYKELDRLYETYASRLSQPDLQQEHILRLCACLNFDMDRALEAGQVDKAKKLNTMIQENLASENLRKKDAKPIEDVRMDSIVERLEKAGLLKDGKPVAPDVMFEKLFGHLPKYPYTADAADQMILKVWNKMQQNDGSPELTILPDDMKLDDALDEFAEQPNTRESENYKKLGLLRMPRHQQEEQQ